MRLSQTRWKHSSAAGDSEVKRALQERQKEPKKEREKRDGQERKNDTKNRSTAPSPCVERRAKKMACWIPNFRGSLGKTPSPERRQAKTKAKKTRRETEEVGMPVATLVRALLASNKGEKKEKGGDRPVGMSEEQKAPFTWCSISFGVLCGGGSVVLGRSLYLSARCWCTLSVPRTFQIPPEQLAVGVACGWRLRFRQFRSPFLFVFQRGEERE